ncbi:MAG: hypothetical protein KatS3mg011_2108 [Acidimicrobiia bacterium]|nr:MAG: hypothetical protein KatS3mg011_2108 [Acidimicrobiia bacterium]
MFEDAHDGNGRPHHFDGTVIAVFPTESSERVVDHLRQAGFQVEILVGEEGRRHLTGEGLMAGIRRVLDVFGDRQRMVDRLDAELAAGNVVVSVDSEPDDAVEAASILDSHGGRYIWRFGTWTDTPMGD